MHRLDYLNIKERHLVTGIHYYDDDFIGSDLRRYSFHQALHLYLKSQGYRTIVFFNTSGGMASYEQPMLERFLMTTEDESARAPRDSEVGVPPVITGRLSGNALTRRINRASKAPGAQTSQTVNASRPQSNLYQDPTDRMWHLKGRNDRQYATECISYNLRVRRDVAVIVKINETEPEFQPPVIQTLIDHLDKVESQTYTNGVDNTNNNRLLVLINTGKYRHSIMKMYDPEEVVHVSQFMSQHFQNKYLYIPNGEDFTTLNPDYTYVLPSPTESDVVNIIMKVRCDHPEKLKYPMDWAVLPDIASQLELKDDKTVRGLYRSISGLKTYDYPGFKTLGVDRRGDARKDLQELIGMEEVKRCISEYAAWIKMKESKGEDLTAIDKHMMLYGNPGTGKTTVARLIGRILKDLGLLKKGHCVEVTREGLVAGFVGQTAIKTRHAVEMALDGVLFVDEAYSLAQGGEDSNDFGKEAMATLIAMMENHRDRLVVILAGYKEDMQGLFALNQGLRSRINKYIDFKDYNADELAEIFRLYIRGKYTLATDAERALPQAIEYILGYRTRARNTARYKFANARTIRNLFESIEMNIARRSESTDTSAIQARDFEGLEMEEMVGYRYSPAESETDHTGTSDNTPSNTSNNTSSDNASDNKSNNKSNNKLTEK